MDMQKTVHILNTGTDDSDDGVIRVVEEATAYCMIYHRLHTHVP